MLAAYTSAFSQMRHLGLSGETGLAAKGAAILCLQQRLGKVVLWSVDLKQKMRDSLCRAESASQARDILSTNQYLLFEKGGFAYLTSDVMRKSQMYSDDQNAYHWHDINVEVAKTNYVDACKEYSDECSSQGEAARQRLNPRQMEDIAKSILKEAVVVPLAPPRAGSDPRVAEIKLQIVMDAMDLKHDGSVSVVTWMSEGSGYAEGRIYYGEIRSDRFLLLWESPVLALRELQLKYLDMNGDSRSDITIEAEDQDRHHRVKDLTVLDLDGNDLTKGKDCLALLSSNPEPGIVCPIISEGGFVFRKLADRTVEIRAGPPFEDIEGAQRVFRVVGGRYQMVMHKRHPKR